MKKLPFVSIITPVYNSESVIGQCLEAICLQDYPKELFEVVIADAGSKDRTIQIIKSFMDKLKIRIISNPLQTGEAGKAEAVKISVGELLAFIDSDNIMPETSFISKMVLPFLEEPEILGSEPIYFTYNEKNKSLTKYFACAGINDPLCLFIGNYDRYSYITGKWTGMKLKTKQMEGYILIELEKNRMPTIGANGTFLRADILKATSYSPYLFDIDAVYQMMEKGLKKFAKVNIGIIHIYSPEFRLFLKKQDRRVKDFMYFSSYGHRKYPWKKFPLKGILMFVVSCITVLPLIFQTFVGFFRKPGIFWIWHIPVCLATFFIYSYEFIRVKITGKTAIKNRDGYGQ